MQYLNEEDILAFYTEAIGKPVLRYPDGLISARPALAVGFRRGRLSNAYDKGSGSHALSSENQPFVDGNKRIAWISGKLFLQRQGLTLPATEEEALDFSGTA